MSDVPIDDLEFERAGDPPEPTYNNPDARDPWMRIRSIVSDGRPIWQLECPGCGRWGEIDDDQLHGRVSVDHTDAGCTFHETHDFWNRAEIVQGQRKALVGDNQISDGKP